MEIYIKLLHTICGIFLIVLCSGIKHTFHRKSSGFANKKTKKNCLLEAGTNFAMCSIIFPAF